MRSALESAREERDALRPLVAEVDRFRAELEAQKTEGKRARAAEYAAGEEADRLRAALVELVEAGDALRRGEHNTRHYDTLDRARELVREGAD